MIVEMGKLIVFEGTDGTGKSTQFSLLTKRLYEGTAFALSQRSGGSLYHGG